MSFLYPFFQPETAITPKPDFGINHTFMNEVNTRVEEKIILRRPFSNLIHFQKNCEAQQPKVLIVAPMSGHFATIAREVVEGLLPDNDVYTTDWLNPRDVDAKHGDFCLNTNMGDLLSFINHIGPNTHLIGISQSTITAIAAASILAQKNSNNQVASLSLIAGPVDTRISPTQMNITAKMIPLQWISTQFYKKIAPEFNGAGRMVFDEQKLSRLLTPSSEHMIHEDGLSAKQRSTRQTDLSSIMGYCATYHTQIYHVVFQSHSLMERELFLNGEVIDPSHVQGTPMLTIEGGNDNIVGSGQTMAAHTLFNSLAENERFRYVDTDACHYGLIMGNNFRAKTLPKLTSFIRHASASPA